MRAWISAAVLALTLPLAASADLDHLACYRLTDPIKLAGTADLATRLGLQPGCKLGHARFLCSPTDETVITANVPVGAVSGRSLADSRICYKVTCRKPFPPDEQVTDEFGSRRLAKPVPRLVCTPAVLGPPLPTHDGLDHLECFKARDPLKLKAVASLDTASFGTMPGCRVGRGRLLCISATTSNVQVNVSPLLDLGGTEADDDRVCYPIACPRPFPSPRVVSDRFGSRTVTHLVPKLVCGPAASAPVTTTTSVTTTTVTTTTFPPGTDPALVCQRAIEDGGMAYAHALLDAVGDCTRPGRTQALDACLASSSVQQQLATARSQWGTGAAAACPTSGPDRVDPRHDLGYAETCGAAPSACTFASPVVTTPGSSNDVLDCLACHIQERIGGAAVALYADRAVDSSLQTCSSTLGDGGLGVLRTTLDTVDQCAKQPGLVSIASCFAPGSAAWRAQAEAACTGVDPYASLSYPRTCSGQMPVFPDSYVYHDPPCTFPVSGRLSDAPPDNDLLDCLTCRAEEGVLGVAQDLHGANLCCIGGTCNKVLTRFACRAAQGTPARYRVSSLPAAESYAHGLDVAPDGSLLVADSGTGNILRITGGSTVTVLGAPLSFPVGVAGDAAGNVYVTNRCSATVVRIAPGGATSVYAGTGTPGYSGDGGPATAAQIMAPDGIAVDPAGNVYFTESNLLGYVCGTLGNATERVRMVDTNGIIHTVAGSGGGGSSGEDGPATAARLSLPYGLRLAGDGTILIGEAGGERVLRVDAGGMLRRVAGRPLSPQGSHAGYGGPAKLARFYENCGVAEDPDGNVLIAPMENNRIALVDTLGSVITIAGTGENSNYGTPSGDGGPGLLAQIGLPEDVVVGPDGKIYVSDLFVSRIRVLTRELY